MATAPILALQEIGLSIGSTLLLDGAALSLLPGEKVALVGRNGSGKSTLLKIAGGLMEPDRGQVRIVVAAAVLGDLRRDCARLGELAPERAGIREAIERMRLIPVMFELGARPHPPVELYRAYLEQSDVFVGVYWQSYGWVAPDAEVSGIHDEFGLYTASDTQLSQAESHLLVQHDSPHACS